MHSTQCGINTELLVRERSAKLVCYNTGTELILIPATKRLCFCGRNTVHRGTQVIDFKPYIDSCVALHTCTCNVSSLPDLHYLHYCAFCGRGSCAIGASSLRSFIVSSLTSLSVCRLVTIRILSTPTHPCNYRTTKCSIQSKARTISPDRLIHPLTRLI